MMDRAEAIRRIKAGLKVRSGKAWSVTGGRGTAWGWLTIDAPPARRKFQGDGVTPTESEFGYPSMADREELAKLLDLKQPTHHQGVSVASSSDYYEEYVARAEGRTPEKYGKPYWD